MRQWTLGFGRASLTPRAKHPGGPNRGYALGCSLTRVPVGHACVCVDGTGRRWWPAAALLGFGGCDAGEACSVPALSRATLFATTVTVTLWCTLVLVELGPAHRWMMTGWLIRLAQVWRVS